MRNKKLTTTAESALALEVIDYPMFNSPCFTLGEASKIAMYYRDAIIEDGGPNIAGAYVYHPVKGIIAYVSPNGRVWHCSTKQDAYVNDKAEFSKDELKVNFNELFKVAA
jgi:hypothetical protein